MVAAVRISVGLLAIVAGALLTVRTSPPPTAGHAGVELRSTDAPMSNVITTTNPKPFDPCNDIPLDVIAGLGLEVSPPTPMEGWRCQYDAGNYQMAVEPIIWRTYAQSLPPDAVETDINGHRAAQFWVMKPTDWNNRWWFSCMVVFKTSYGVIQQSLFYSPVYSNPDVDCMQENLMRAQQLSPHYIF
ncbi:DUF3558 domain-containing protein [Mycobacterium sp. ENV421]|uniref:DUF3558 domain-containing protein n=1 Tax=Mycobacterium sp. ENV421 TaxID=1213407 RepID=UPI000C9C6EF9|nr:DUF3558 domain-containing protein [Mycobacterium sp. ENV421]PND54461.1 DUF3558 domain-containing protein [Mycobacterium sp. ENV421]